MPIAFNAELMADVAAVATRAARFAYKAQFDSDTPEQVAWAESVRRHALGPLPAPVKSHVDARYR